MTVAEFKKQAYGIDRFIIFYMGTYHKATIYFDNYIITEFNFETDCYYRVICTLDVIEPQK